MLTVDQDIFKCRGVVFSVKFEHRLIALEKQMQLLPITMNYKLLPSMLNTILAQTLFLYMDVFAIYCQFRREKNGNSMRRR